MLYSLMLSTTMLSMTSMLSMLVFLPTSATPGVEEVHQLGRHAPTAEDIAAYARIYNVLCTR